MIRAIYVEQFGSWWKLSPEEWRELCIGGAAGNGHELPPAKELSRRSPLIAVYDPDGDGKLSYCALRQDIRVYSPLDWQPEDYRWGLQELKEENT